MLLLVVTATEKRTRVPFLSEVTLIYPPKASTKDFEVDRPTPIPEVSLPSYFKPDFRMEKVSKRPDILFAGIPFPLSVISVVNYPRPFGNSMLVVFFCRVSFSYFSSTAIPIIAFSGLNLQAFAMR